MVKVWIHKPGSDEPLLAANVTIADAMRDFDLDQAEFISPPDANPQRPEPLVDDTDPEAVVFEVESGEQDGKRRAGYYASRMTADTIQELIAEEWAKGAASAGKP